MLKLSMASHLFVEEANQHRFFFCYFLASAPAFLISSRNILIIGEISGGCHLAFFGSSGQIKGR